MDSFEFLVRGPAAEPYRVSFRREGRNLSAHCNCPDGEGGRYCDHRINILRGSIEGVVSENAADAATVASWLKGTDVDAALQSVIRLEKEAGRINQALAEAKQTLSEYLLD
jgi:uncharacterized Zn finger protein